MKRLAALPAALAIACAFASTGLAAQETYKVDPNHATANYEIRHFGVSTQRGFFNKVTGTATIDTAAKKGTADITIDMASVTAHVPKLSEHLRSEDFFDAAKFPTATFKSTDFRFDGDKPASIAGELTIKGVSKPVTLAVSSFTCSQNPMNKKAMCGAEATATIKRSEWGVTKFIPAVADEVKLIISVEAYKE